MEARATLNGPSVSKTFVAAVLVLVAMGLGAMGGYAFKGLGASGASTTTVNAPVHPAAGTVLRQDNPARAIRPNRIQKDDALTVVRPAPGTVLRQDNPARQQPDSSATKAVRGDHGYIP